MATEIFAAALDYYKSRSLDGKEYKIIRMRVLADNGKIWLESVGTVAEHLEENEIATYGISDTVARINTRQINLADFADYDPDVPVDGLCVRTFLTVYAGEEDIFAEDSAWSIKFGSKTLREWYMTLKQIPIV